jgi:hypothetical protein
MYKVNLSLKLITVCSLVGKDIPEFVEKMNSCGFYTYIEDYRDNEEFDENDEVDVMVFKSDTK